MNNTLNLSTYSILNIEKKLFKPQRTTQAATHSFSKRRKLTNDRRSRAAVVFDKNTNDIFSRKKSLYLYLPPPLALPAPHGMSNGQRKVRLYLHLHPVFVTHLYAYGCNRRHKSKDKKSLGPPHPPPTPPRLLSSCVGRSFRPPHMRLCARYWRPPKKN